MSESTSLLKMMPMNSRERRRQKADEHNYERWLYENTRDQRKPKFQRNRVSPLAAMCMAMTQGMNVRIIS